MCRDVVQCHDIPLSRVQFEFHVVSLLSFLAIGADGHMKSAQ